MVQKRGRKIHKKESKKVGSDYSTKTVLAMMVLVTVISLLSLGIYLYALYNLEDHPLDAFMVREVNFNQSATKNEAAGMAAIHIIKDPNR